MNEQCIDVREKHVFFCGLGGAGMLALALYARHAGAYVTGTDSDAQGCKKAMQHGFNCHMIHDASQVDDADVFVYSSAIREDNPEWRRARERGLPCIHRATFLRGMLHDKKMLSIAGTHGKTTTTALAARMLEDGGMDPVALVGGDVPSFHGNARLGNGEWCVTETDESDGSFQFFTSDIGVILNIDKDHLEHYGSFSGLCAAFETYAQGIKADGALVYNCDDELTEALAKRMHVREMYACGESAHADVRISDVRIDGWNTHCRLTIAGESVPLTIGMPGRHNVINAACAAAAAHHAGVPFSAMQSASASFHGVRRRCERIGTFNGALVIDDYAHHPCEIRASYAAIHSLGARVIAVFEPHRYTRTRALRDEFVAVLSAIEPLCIMRIFAASETPEAAAEEEFFHTMCAHNSSVFYASDTADARTFLEKTVESGDIILCMGAGNISHFAHSLVETS